MNAVEMPYENAVALQYRGFQQEFNMHQGSFELRLKEVRVENGLIQEELAVRCRLDIRTIQRIEAGKVYPRIYPMRIINETLGTNIRDSFYDDSADHELATLRKKFQKRRSFRIWTAGAAIALMLGVLILSDSNWNLFGMPKRVWAPISIWSFLFT